ncbi:hypothetical protein [Maricaulis sp. CAU 1757]
MAQAFSIPGCEIRFDNGRLELRSDGPRTPALLEDSQRALEIHLKCHAVSSALMDVRGAEYEMNSANWSQTARTMARLFRDCDLAVVCRSDQTGQMKEVIEAHKDHGGKSQCFSSRTQALPWLNGTR